MPILVPHDVVDVVFVVGTKAEGTELAFAFVFDSCFLAPRTLLATCLATMTVFALSL